MNEFIIQDMPFEPARRGKAMHDYVLEHLVPGLCWKREGSSPVIEHIVKRPLRAYKKVFTGAPIAAADAIATLTIPVGAVVVFTERALHPHSVSRQRQMRASMAAVESITEYVILAEHERRLEADALNNRLTMMIPMHTHNVASAHSGYNAAFKYRVGDTVQPEDEFDHPQCGMCASGIHFFVDMRDAVLY